MYVLIFIVELKVLVYSYPFVKEYDVNFRSVNKPVNFGKNIKKIWVSQIKIGALALLCSFYTKVNMCRIALLLFKK